ncbi:hypothetical protein ACFYWS_36765 [Streptomyces sp. NPDC002795]|uniref:hypothetical protein n=1 Tax=Streptomyces sp. NPDC002795 TaxID=3364665 RepID=UPI0036A7A556
MRFSRRVVPALAALTLLFTLPYDAVSDEKPTKRRAPSGASCRIDIDRDLVSATCHNPYPTIDRVALHIECDEWWDIDTDTRPKAVLPAETLRLDGRCWKNVRTAWVSHHKPSP